MTVFENELTEFQQAVEQVVGFIKQPVKQ